MTCKDLHDLTPARLPYLPLPDLQEFPSVQPNWKPEDKKIY